MTANIMNRQTVIDAMFKQYDMDSTGELTPPQLQTLHASLRQGGISLPQVVASMKYSCLCDDTCEESELFDCLQEMDRRYFLVQDFRWEFAMLDRLQADFISEEQARYGCGVGCVGVKGCVCGCDDTCVVSELFDCLQEMDRRYFLVQDFRWEFAMLDRLQADFISEEHARFLFEVVHGDLFSKRRWDRFLKSRAVPGSGVTFSEIEVDLCNIPSREELALEKLEEEKEREEKALKLMERKLSFLRLKRDKQEKQDEAHKANDDQEKKKIEASNKKKEEEEDLLRKQREEAERRKREEEQGKLEAEEREKERRRLEQEKERERERELEIIEVQQALEAQRELEKAAKELEEQEKKELEQAKNVEEEAEAAKAREKEAEEEAKKAREALKNASDAASKRAAEEAEKAANEKAKRERNERIRKDLKVAIKKKDYNLLNKSVSEFKKAKLADTEGDLAKAEHLLKRFKAKENLISAMDKRKLEDLEKAINFVKKNGFEAAMPEEMIKANKMLLSLKRLKRLKDEILNLKQSTVAEIRSYSKPPKAVHRVMIGTYLLLGMKEKNLQDWKGMQALIGKTSKEGLKRRVLECDPNKIKIEAAARTKKLLQEFDLEEIRDCSAGAAVFFAWASATADEIEDREKQKAEGIEPTDIKNKKKIKTELKSGSITVKI